MSHLIGSVGYSPNYDGQEDSKKAVYGGVRFHDGRDTPVMNSPLETIVSASKYLNETENRLRALFEKLIGPWPVKSSEAAQQPVSSSIIGSLSDTGRAMRATLDRINEGCAAVERQLP